MDMTIQNMMLADGVGYLPLRDNRFKTSRLSVGIFLPLKEETAAAYAILPELLTHATAHSPNMIALHRRQSRLYGAAVMGGVQRLGDHQVITLSVSCIENSFALAGEDVVTACAQLLCEMLFCPHLSADGLFDAVDVEQEKRCLKERIAAAINDKRAYARMQCDALLASGEPYGVPACGTMETAEALTRESITAAWKSMLKTAVFQWFYAGADDGEAVKACIRTAFDGIARAPYAGKTVTDFTPLENPRRGFTRIQVNQAKLVMTFRMQAHEPDTQSVMTARLLSALFGGTPSSLLFSNVREKMSLCYYCGSSFERVKGVLTVDSGVDAANVGRAEAEILRQLDHIRCGDFSDEDLESARRYVINHLKDGENLQSTQISWFMGQTLCPPFRSVQETVLMMQKVTKEQIVALANTVTLAAVFTVLPEEDNA